MQYLNKSWKIKLKEKWKEVREVYDELRDDFYEQNDSFFKYNIFIDINEEDKDLYKIELYRMVYIFEWSIEEIKKEIIFRIPFKKRK